MRQSVAPSSSELSLPDRLVRYVTWARISGASGRVMLGCHGVSAMAGGLSWGSGASRGNDVIDRGTL